MPAYDFKCKKCSRTIEVTRGARDDSPVPCPECGEPMKLVFHAVGVHFKGSGFHATDYPRPRTVAKTEADAKPDAPACDAAGSSPSCEGCPSAD
jgi:putative FmdB family regulatory protein